MIFILFSFLVYFCNAGPPTKMQFTTPPPPAVTTPPQVNLPPMTIEVLDNTNQKTTDANLIIVVKCTGGVFAKQPPPMAVTNGAATFSQLAFTAATSCPLTFTLFPPPYTTTVAPLVAGNITVENVPTFDIVFAANSFLTKTTTADVVAGKALSNVVIKIVDSLYDLSNVTGVEVVATDEKGVLKLKGEKGTSIDGYVTFDALTLDAGSTPGANQLTFTVTTPALMASGKSITANITIQATSVGNYAIQFAAQESRITLNKQSYVAAKGASLPRIVVEVVDSALQRDTTSQYSITVTAGLRTVVSGTTTVPVKNGIASFDDLKLTSCSKGTSLTFDVSATQTLAKKEREPLVIVLDAAPADGIRFAATSGLQTTTTTEMNLGVPLAAPPVIELFDSCGEIDTVSTVDVTASCEFSLKGNKVQYSKGTPVAFTDLIVDWSNAITVSVTKDITFMAAGKSVTSKINVIVSYKIRFVDLTPATLPASTPLQKVEVEVVYSNGTRVSATTLQGEIGVSLVTSDNTLTGTQSVPVVGGVASFSDLSLANCLKGAQLVFEGKSAQLSGKLTLPVQNMLASDIRFTSESFLKATGTSTITMGVTLLPVIIELRDSCSNVDVTTQNLPISVTSLFVVSTIKGTTATLFRNGRAVFNSFSVETAATQQVLSFVVGKNVSVPAAGKIINATLNVIKDITPNYKVRFALMDSFYTQEGQTKKVSKGVALPPIVVEVINTKYERDTTLKQMDITVKPVPSTVKISGTLTVKVVDGIATFSDLSLNDCSKNTTFEFVVSALNQAYDNLKTGSITITSNVTTQLTVQKGIVTRLCETGTCLSSTTVYVMDECGETAVNGSVWVTASGTTAGINGVVTVLSQNGVAVFDTITLLGKTAIQFDSIGLVSATTDVFELKPATCGGDKMFKCMSTNGCTGNCASCLSYTNNCTTHLSGPTCVATRFDCPCSNNTFKCSSSDDTLDCVSNVTQCLGQNSATGTANLSVVCKTDKPFQCKSLKCVRPLTVEILRANTLVEDSPMSFLADVDYDECESRGALSYEWKITQEPNILLKPSISMSERELIIPAKTLKSTVTYTIAVVVTVQDDVRRSASSNVTIQVVSARANSKGRIVGFQLLRVNSTLSFSAVAQFGTLNSVFWVCNGCPTSWALKMDSQKLVKEPPLDVGVYMLSLYTNCDATTCAKVPADGYVRFVVHPTVLVEVGIGLLSITSTALNTRIILGAMNVIKPFTVLNAWTINGVKGENSVPTGTKISTRDFSFSMSALKTGIVNNVSLTVSVENTTLQLITLGVYVPPVTQGTCEVAARDIGSKNFIRLTAYGCGIGKDYLFLEDNIPLTEKPYPSYDFSFRSPYISKDVKTRDYKVLVTDQITRATVTLPCTFLPGTAVVPVYDLDANSTWNDIKISNVREEMIRDSKLFFGVVNIGTPLFADIVKTVSALYYNSGKSPTWINQILFSDFINRLSSVYPNHTLVMELGVKLLLEKDLGVDSTKLVLDSIAKARGTNITIMKFATENIAYNLNWLEPSVMLKSDQCFCQCAPVDTIDGGQSDLVFMNKDNNAKIVTIPEIALLPPDPQYGHVQNMVVSACTYGCQDLNSSYVNSTLEQRKLGNNTALSSIVGVRAFHIASPTQKEMLVNNTLAQILIRLQMGESVSKDTNFTCMYWNEDTRAWATDGVIRSDMDVSPLYGRCLTRHLTEFGAFKVPVDPVAASQPTAAPSDNGGITNIMIIAVVAVIAVVLLAATIYMIMYKRMQKVPEDLSFQHLLEMERKWYGDQMEDMLYSAPNKSSTAQGQYKNLEHNF